MDLLNGYGGSDSSDEDGAPPGAAPAAVTRRVVANPAVDTTAYALKAHARAQAEAAARAGGAGVALQQRTSNATGSVIESAGVEVFDFEEQMNSFSAKGYAIDAVGNVQGDAARAHEDAVKPAKRRREGRAAAAEPRRRARRKAGPGGGRLPPRAVMELVSSEDASGGPLLLSGPWAETGAGAAEGEAEAAAAGAGGAAAEGEGEGEGEGATAGEAEGAAESGGSDAFEARSIFHGASLVDGVGRAWCAAPKGLRAGGGDHDCFVPKRCVHTWDAHAKGVNRIRWMPRFGHLLLSASNDGSVKVWDAARGRRLLRSYLGHGLGVKDIDVAPGGAAFLSSGFDRRVRLWDVESGANAFTLDDRKMAFCVRFHPEDPSAFLAACADSRVRQYDLRSGACVQEYAYHLSAVNSVCFVDGGRSFVSTSDDKKVLVWEYGVPVPIKYIAEPHMQSMPSTCLHPSGKYWVGQSMDNAILVYEATGKFRQAGRKAFRRLSNTGYALGMSFSPDGRYLASGDGEGRLLFYDFRSTKQLKRFGAHDRARAADAVTMDAQWHPLEPSWCASAGWDGKVRLWE